MADTVPEVGPDACSGCRATQEELEAVSCMLYVCDKCGAFVCSSCSATSDDDKVVCESCATPEEWRRG